MRRPTWKNVALFIAYPVIAAFMAVACLAVLVAAWPVALVTDLDKTDEEPT